MEDIIWIIEKADVLSDKKRLNFRRHKYSLNDVVKIIARARLEELINLKDIFPITLQPLGTKKETMIPKWKAIKEVGLIIEDRIKELKK